MALEDISLTSFYLTNRAKVVDPKIFCRLAIPHLFHCRGVDVFLLAHAKVQALHYRHLSKVSALE
jgi:hypothetical protein